MTPPVLMSVQITLFLLCYPSWRLTGKHLRHCESANIFQPFRGNLRPSNSQENKTRQQVHEAGTESTSNIWTLYPTIHSAHHLSSKLQLPARKYLSSCHNFGFIHVQNAEQEKHKKNIKLCELSDKFCTLTIRSDIII